MAFFLVSFAAVAISSEAAKMTAAQQVWAQEQEIYARRALGDGMYYSSVSSEHYLGWPAPAAKPISYDSIRQQGTSGEFKSGEKIQVVSDGIALDGDTAISYFSTHRTVRPGGQQVDERYENIHVYVHRQGRWRLVGAMSRRVLPDDLRSAPLGGKK